MESEYLKIAIAYKVPPEVAQMAVKLSGEISRQAETYYVIDNSNIHPHVSIYHVKILTRNIEAVLEKIKDITKSVHPVKFIAGNIHVTRGYIDVGAKNAENMQLIHENVVKNISLLREIDREKDRKKLSSTELTDEKRENIEKYGDTNLMKLYRPHLTFTKLKDEKNAEKIAREIHCPIAEFVLNTIGVYELGEKGTCLKNIKEFDLE